MNPQETITLLQDRFSGSRQDITLCQCILKAIPYAIVFADQQRQIVMVNKTLETIFDYQEQELLGKTTDILYASKEEYENQGRVRFHPNSEEKLQAYEVDYRKKDGTIFPSETIGTVLLDENGKTFGFLGLIQDISDRKKVEDSLRELELMYRTVADFTYDWETWTNLDSSFRYVSPSCERITGYTAGHFMQNPKLFKEIIVPEDRKLWDDHHSSAKKKFKLREVQFRIKRADGTIAWIEHACQPVPGSQGKVSGFRSSNRDITERKRVEEELQQALEKIQRYKDQLEIESKYLRSEIEIEHSHKNIIGSSNAIQYVLFKVEQIAATDTNVLILGETGTGKEVIARAIHSTSLRKDRPLVKLNCAALPANLIESELFGHEKGAFTGANGKHIGRFEVAHGATLFLDEIGELPLELQAKLLRILQDGEFERLGSTRTRKVDVRVIAATNRDLELDAREGRFRKDLWYRLNVFPITAPPLRDRTDDISLLVSYFVERFSKKQGKEITLIPEDVVSVLQKYPWPGNVRELENIIERAVINTLGNRLQLADGLETVREEIAGNHFKPLCDMEREYIIRVLDETNWKVSGKNSAAEILEIDRSTLRGRMKKLGIRPPK